VQIRWLKTKLSKTFFVAKSFPEMRCHEWGCLIRDIRSPACCVILFYARSETFQSMFKDLIEWRFRSIPASHFNSPRWEITTKNR
jgi:hypothetical protein